MTRWRAEPWRSVALLAVAYSSTVAGIFVNVAISALFMRDNAGTAFASLPSGANAFVGAGLLALGPMAFFERRFGKRRTFVGCFATAVCGSVLQAIGAFSVVPTLVVVGAGMQGFSYAAGNACRFAAADIAPAEERAKAVSVTVLGGVLAALGPEIGRITVSAIPDAEYVGSYIAAGVILFVGLAAVSSVRFKEDGKAPGADEAPDQHTAAEQVSRGDTGGPASAPLPATDTKLQSPCASSAVGASISTVGCFATMAAMMQTTPVAMLDAGYERSVTVWVTEAHILGMFLPSLFSGSLVRWLGAQPSVVLGWVLLAIGGSLPVVVAGKPEWAYFVGLFTLGVGWNFAYVGSSLMVASVSLPAPQAASMKRVVDGVTMALSGISILSSGAVFDAVRHDAWWLYVGAACFFGCLAVAHWATPTPGIPRVVSAGTRLTQPSAVATAAGVMPGGDVELASSDKPQ